jgi:DNA-directed RNA polymerase subunit H (RpoH/RPB5)
MTSSKFTLDKHILVPKHVKLNDRDKKQLFDKYKITIRDLPKIDSKDPAILSLKVKAGDVVKIQRNTPGIGESMYYRGVIDVK